MRRSAALLLARQYARLPRLEWQLRHASLGEVCQQFGIVPPNAGEGDAGNTPPAEVRLEAERLHALLRGRGLRISCLRCALLVGRQLSRYRPRLIIGFRLAPQPEGHAWLQVGDWELGRDYNSRPLRPRTNRGA